MLVLAFQKCHDCRLKRSNDNDSNGGIDGQLKHNLEINNVPGVINHAEQIYPQLIFQLIDNAKPRPDRHSQANGGG